MEPERYKKKRWIRLRLSVLKRDKYQCQECKRKGVIRDADMVHHCNPDALDMFYDTGNLISLCNTCHNTMHDRITDELTENGMKWLLRSQRGQISRIKIL